MYCITEVFLSLWKIINVWAIVSIIGVTCLHVLHDHYIMHALCALTSFRWDQNFIYNRFYCCHITFYLAQAAPSSSWRRISCLVDRMLWGTTFFFYLSFAFPLPHPLVGEFIVLSTSTVVCICVRACVCKVLYHDCVVHQYQFPHAQWLCMQKQSKCYDMPI